MLQHEANQAGRYLRDGFSPQQLGGPLKLFYAYVQVTAMTHLKPFQGVSFNFRDCIILFYTYNFLKKNHSPLNPLTNFNGLVINVINMGSRRI